MLRALGFGRQSPAVSNEEATRLVLQQANDFELALQAMDYLLDDRTKEGLHLINDDPECTIKVLASGVIGFLEATLGFEPEVMKKAGEVLTRAENLSYRDRAKHQKTKLQTSSRFPPGTEYAVTYAEANLLNALVMLVSESVIESAKALYKLRKAYQILDEVLKLIKQSEKPTKRSKDSASSVKSSTASLNSRSTSASQIFPDVPFEVPDKQLTDTEIIAVANKVKEMRNARLRGAHIGNPPASERLRADLGFKNDEKANHIDKEIDEDHSTVDEFIITGANLCFGILQLVLSLIPPALGKVLSVVGIKGTREAGLRMIWASVDGRNIHGCIGLLGLLVFYDGPFQFTDSDFDVPEIHRTVTGNSTANSVSISQRGRKMTNELEALEGIGKPTLLHPGKKLEDALLYARALFPHSALWLLQEARMLASGGRLEEALSLMESIDRDIEMQQVEALLIFDKVMILIFLHKFEKAAVEVLKLVDINQWSPGLYTYIAGSCYVELYRMGKLGLLSAEDAPKTNQYKIKAKKYLLEAPVHTQNKKIMSKQMPFDKFLLRKVGQFKNTAATQKVDLVDAIGASPIHELMYFWNGYNRMPEDHLELSLKLLNYGISEHALVPEVENQLMIRSLLESITHRRLGEYSKGCNILDSAVLKYIIVFDQNGKQPYTFIRHVEDPWLYPTALYERALFTWKEKGLSGLDEAKDWLKIATAYADDYELSTRVSMKIKAALDRLEGI